MATYVCLIPSSLEDPSCKACTVAFGDLIEAAGDLTVRILPLPSETFSVADTRVDEIFQKVVTAIKSMGDAVLNEAIVMSVEFGASGLTIHFGRDRRTIPAGMSLLIQ